MEEILDQEELSDERGIPKIHKPSLLIRIKSSMIDSMVVLLLLFIAFEILNRLKIESGIAKGIILTFIILYEPIFVSLSRTLGQKFMGLHVRKFSLMEDGNQEANINIFFSIIRFLAKIFLGWVSLLTIHGDDYGRAIHDKLGGSVMTIE